MPPEGSGGSRARRASRSPASHRPEGAPAAILGHEAGVFFLAARRWFSGMFRSA
jgi:hypothetical protein